MTQLALPTATSNIPVGIELPIMRSARGWSIQAPDQPPPAASESIDVLTLGLDQSGTPLLLLASDGDVRHINHAARSMLRHSAIFSLRHNRVHIRRKHEAAALLRAIQLAEHSQARAQSPSTIVNFQSREGSVVASILLRPLASRGFPGFIILRIADFTSRPTRQIAWIEEVFGLTPAEGKIANGLLEGLSVNDIASREGNAVETVRNHIKRAMAKASARSQAQFVSMLTRAHMALVDPDTDDHPGQHLPGRRLSGRRPNAPAVK